MIRTVVQPIRDDIFKHKNFFDVILMDKNQSEFIFPFLLSLTSILVDGKVNIEGKCSQAALTLFRMGFFGAAHEWGGEGVKRPTLLKICHTHPAMMKLGTVIPYLKKIQKTYKSRVTPLENC